MAESDAHAVAQGGAGNLWDINLRLASARLHMVAAEDFNWAKVNGAWRTQSCPLGERAVNWPRAFSILAAAQFKRAPGARRCPDA